MFDFIQEYILLSSNSLLISHTAHDEEEGASATSGTSTPAMPLSPSPGASTQSFVETVELPESPQIGMEEVSGAQAPQGTDDHSYVRPSASRSSRGIPANLEVTLAPQMPNA